MAVVLWTTYAFALTLLWGREWLVWREARRADFGSQRASRRFRRRSLGLALLLASPLSVELIERLEETYGLIVIPLYGFSFIMVALVLLIALRDLRETLAAGAREQQEAALEAIRQLERRNRPDEGPGLRAAETEAKAASEEESS